uniref:Uncharacterized protein n=1 Tax=Janibacter limosus TaxID=53458 RepID=A0AC61U4A4_9MICO|nr:hypothetical protein [Janibacter limosus]
MVDPLARTPTRRPNCWKARPASARSSPRPAMPPGRPVPRVEGGQPHRRGRRHAVDLQELALVQPGGTSPGELAVLRERRGQHRRVVVGYDTGPRTTAVARRSQPRQARTEHGPGEHREARDHSPGDDPGPGRATGARAGDADVGVEVVARRQPPDEQDREEQSVQPPAAGCVVPRAMVTSSRTKGEPPVAAATSSPAPSRR